MNLKTWAAKERGRGLLLAKALGVQPPSVSDWITGKKQVPLEQCVPIERFTSKEVTCEEMRPDKTADFAYLRGFEPELAPAACPNGIERRHHNTPQHPDLERRALPAAALAGQGVG